MFRLPKFGRGLCLARLARLLARLGVDRRRLARISIVVTGSNGKGSTAAFTAAIGRAYGLRTGLFTSPHLYRFNERFQIDGEPIGDEPLGALVRRIEAAAGEVVREFPGEFFGGFEAQFALACLWFEEAGVELAVIEAGIGGRYDPVRLAGATCAAVTSVDLEHTSILGDRLELIVCDKSDACAAGGTIVYGGNCLPLRPLIEEYNGSRGVASHFVGDDIAVEDAAVSPGGQTFGLRLGSWRVSGLGIGLAGRFQLDNAAIAAALFRCWLERDGRLWRGEAACADAIREGLARAAWPGRMEVIRSDPLTIVDVGHTPDAIAQVLAGVLAAHGREGWVLVTGVSADKKAEEIVSMLAPAFDVIVATRAHHKGADVRAIAVAARQSNPAAVVHEAPSIEAAAELSQRLALERGGRVLVAGGLFLAAEYAEALRGRDPRALSFF